MWFQSPDGDSLCPDYWEIEVVVPLGSRFSPLTGILYVRTTGSDVRISTDDGKFQSPDGDSLCPDYEYNNGMESAGRRFQSPDGDSLCPDRLMRETSQLKTGSFSPLTGILYVRTSWACLVLGPLAIVSVP